MEETRPISPTLAVALVHASQGLEDVTETPRLDAEILLGHAMGISRAQLLARLREATAPPNFDELLQRRLRGEPIAYILGEWEFFGRSFATRAPVLVPRPETEHLVEAVLEHIGTAPARVLEIGVGSGCVSVSIACEARQASIIATDKQPHALGLAHKNAALHEVDSRIGFRQGDLFEALEPEDAPFDVVCSNPPYVEESAWPTLSATIRDYEDPTALLAGPDGLDVVRRLIDGAWRRLNPEGLLAFEIGMGQYEAVVALLEQRGYTDIAYRRDLAGIERIASARKPTT